MVSAVEAAWIALLVLGAGSLLFGVVSLADGVRFLTRARRAFRESSEFCPPAAVLVPVRGEDPHFGETFEALRDQEYPDYRLVFIVDQGDVAEERLQQVSAQGEVTVVLSKSLRSCSGKIAALLAGLEHLDERDEVLVFADSDIRPDKKWLSSLVAPLGDPTLGACTGYRWYFATRGGLGPSMQSAWNAAAANVLFSQKWTYLWGGSYAMRRTILDDIEIEERWKRSLSDDMVMTQALKEKGYRIVFSPRATVASYTDNTLGKTVGWTNRQACLALLYAPAMRRLTVPYAIYTASTVMAAIALGLGILTSAFLLPATLLLSPLYLGLVKGVVRRRAFREAMPEFRNEFSGHRALFYLATAALPILMLLNVRRASKMRGFEWRGKVYSFTSPEDISVAEYQTSGS